MAIAYYIVFVTRIGPVVLILTRTHGVHSGDSLAFPFVALAVGDGHSVASAPGEHHALTAYRAAMPALLPPYRADHVGSLLRPQSVLKARDDAAAGRITAGALRAIEDDAIRDVVKMQEDVGLQAATDGEFRRGSWHMDFIYQLGGVGKSDETLRIEMRNDTEEIAFETAALQIGKLGLPKTIFADDFTFLKSATSLTPKLTVPSPSMVHYRGGPAAIDKSVYPTMDEFWDDLSAAYAKEVAGLAEPRMHLPSVRRHEPRLPQRPGREGEARRTR